ncbi:MAG TPA: dihydrolipoamide acetyltransferase family protein, partial [Gaiellaceae bacterium]|nr:dihydrolipoamide acetyltransferase family protein [Gaiellaceae bacterium]
MATGTQIDVVMPQMGVSVSEGTITKWLKQEGEAISADESLLEISTDKVDTEVPSPGEGVVAKILVQEGETVEVGTVLAVIAPEGAQVETPAEAPPEPATQQAADESEAAAAEGVAAEPAAPGTDAAPPAAPAPATAPSGGDNGKTFVSPVVARIASEHGVDPAQVQGSGRGGRVTKKDILAFVESGAPDSASATPAAPAARPAPLAQAQPAGDGESEEPMTAMRRGIAEHMRRSLDTSAHVTSAIEVDMSKVVALRGKLKAEYGAAYGVNPTYLAFIARATVETLKDYPWINGELRGDKIVTRNFVNLGFAVELADGKGLIVPVL